MDRDEGLRVLAASGWLSRAPEEFRDTLLSASRWRQLPAGAPVTMAGEGAADVIGLASGIVELSSVFGRADTPMLTLGHAVFWLGYGPLISGQPRRATAIARTEVHVASIAPTVIQAALARRPEWWQHLLPLALLYGDTAVTIAADLLIRGSERRCAAVLLRLSGARRPGPADAGRIDVPVTQDELASAANLSRNSAGNALRKFALKRLVETDYGRIIVVDPSRLRTVADG